MDRTRSSPPPSWRRPSATPTRSSPRPGASSTSAGRPRSSPTNDDRRRRPWSSSSTSPPATWSRRCARRAASPSDIVSMQIFVTDVAAYKASLRELGAVWQRHFGRHYPATGLFGVTRLFDDDGADRADGRRRAPRRTGDDRAVAMSTSLLDAHLDAPTQRELLGRRAALAARALRAARRARGRRTGALNRPLIARARRARPARPPLHARRRRLAPGRRRRSSCA